MSAAQSCPILCKPGQNTGVCSLSLHWGSSNPGIKPRSTTQQVDSLPAEPQRKPMNTGVGWRSLLQRTFPTQDLNQGLLTCRWILYQLSYQISSVQNSHSVVSPRTAAHQASLSITNSGSLLKLMSQLVGDLIDCLPPPQPSHPLLSPSPPAFDPSGNQGLFQLVRSLHQVAKVLQFGLQHQSFQLIFRTDFIQDGLVGSPCSPRESQDSSPTPQFKSINSTALSSLYSPTLTSIHDYWKIHNLDQLDFCWQSNVSAF